MRLVKIALGSVNSTVGAVRSNTDRCVTMAEEMAAHDVTVAAFPEQVIGGYPAEDLSQWRQFVAAQWSELQRFAAATKEFPTVHVLGVTVAVGGHLYNCAAVVHRGCVLGVVPKEKLPTYNVFYEARTFSVGVPGRVQDVLGVPFGDVIFAFDFGTIAAELCEDVWSPDGPMRRHCYAGAELVVNISASPFRLGVRSTRQELLATRSSDNQCTSLYVTAVGANDGLVFDGGGFIHQNGRLILEAPRFEQGWWSSVVDLDRTARMRTEATTWRTDCVAATETMPSPHTVQCTGTTSDRSALAYPVPRHGSFFLPPSTRVRDARAEFCEEVLDALALGVGDYFEKTGAFTGLGVALSGGRDSVLTLLVAWRYLQRRLSSLSRTDRAERVAQMLKAFYMPTRFSSKATQESAARITADLGVPMKVLSIEDAFARESAAATSMLDEGALSDVTSQNVQARIRAARMWNWANSSGMLFLQTGNMSEKAMGYTTIGGDLEGALAVLANVPKTVVIFLLEYLAERHGFEGIRLTLSSHAGPELALNQKGEEELMPFAVLDACLFLYAAEKLSPDEMRHALAAMFPEQNAAQLGAWVEKFVRLFTQSVFKWVQAPLSIHLGNLDLDRERALQLPVVRVPPVGVLDVSRGRQAAG